MYTSWKQVADALFLLSLLDCFDIKCHLNCDFSHYAQYCLSLKPDFTSSSGTEILNKTSWSSDGAYVWAQLGCDESLPGSFRKTELIYKVEWRWEKGFFDLTFSCQRRHVQFVQAFFYTVRIIRIVCSKCLFSSYKEAEETWGQWSAQNH